jgi:hypothetical protein
MTDTSRAPERIWIEDERPIGGTCHVYNEWSHGVEQYAAPYIPEDISLTRVAAAYEAAANEVDCGGCSGTCADPSNCHSKDAAIIRALTPADAQAALDRLMREAEERGFWAGRSCGGAKAEIDAALAAIRNRGKGDE